MILKGECTCGTNTSSNGKTFDVTDIKCKIHGFGIEKPLDQTQELLNEARDQNKEDGNKTNTINNNNIPSV
tara:strand:+ start:399 stop:611 length:213 start_codon:yes stop_codon:yes gene_type:complete